MQRAEAFLRDQIPYSKQALLPGALTTAYKAAREFAKDSEILKVASAKANFGRVIQWSVDLAMERLVKSGQWPYDYRWQSFEKPTGSYLEIRPSTYSVLTISQVADPRHQPRNVGFRTNLRLSGQRWLTGLEPDDSKVGGTPHIILMHGHQKLDFIHLGIPHELHDMGFYHRTQNLMVMPHAVDSDEVAVEDTDREAVMTLKEEIDRWRKDHEFG